MSSDLVIVSAQASLFFFSIGSLENTGRAQKGENPSIDISPHFICIWYDPSQINNSYTIIFRFLLRSSCFSRSLAMHIFQLLASQRPQQYHVVEAQSLNNWSRDHFLLSNATDRHYEHLKTTSQASVLSSIDLCRKYETSVFLPSMWWAWIIILSDVSEIGSVCSVAKRHKS